MNKKVCLSRVLKNISYILFPIILTILVFLVFCASYPIERDAIKERLNYYQTNLFAENYAMEIFSTIETVNILRDDVTISVDGYYYRDTESIKESDGDITINYYSHLRGTNLVWLIIDNDTKEAFTNLTYSIDTSNLDNIKNKIHENEVYWEYENGIIETTVDKLNNDNIQYINSGIKQQNVEVADVNKKEEYNYTIYTAVLDDLEYFDNIYSDRLIYNTLTVVNRNLVFLIPILVLMLIGLIPVVIIGIGRNNKTEGTALNWYDKILIELATLIAIFIGCIGTVFIVSVNSVSTLVSFIMAMSVIAVGLIIIYLSCIMLFETIVKRIKTHTFVKTTIAYWLYIKIKDFIGDMKITKKLVLYFILFIIANLISFAIMWSDGFSGLVLTIILYAITYAHMAKRVKSYAKINNAIDNLYKGNTDIQLKKEDVCKEMQNIAEEINDIAGGLSNAIEEKLKSERLKTELITNVSHDIKTPLTSIINYVDLLKKEKTDGEKAEEYLNILDNKSQRLKKLTEDLVEASKASAGAIKLNMEKLNVRELIKQVSGEFEDKFKAHQLEEIISFPENDIYIMADSRYMYRILENMYSNISKYAMEGTRVYTDITEKDNNVYIQIKNVSKQKLNISADELMQRFVRGEASRNTEGSGLGLSIARSLTELQQGTFNIYLDGDLFKVTIQFATI